MRAKSRSSQIPPPSVVRTVGVVLLLIDIAIAGYVIWNFSSFDLWFAILVLAGSIGTAYLPIKAIQTGDPEWVLLDLLLPS